MSLLFAIAMYVAVHLDNLISIRFWAACIGRLGVALHPSVRSDVLVEDEVVEDAAPRMMAGNVIVVFGRYFLHLQEREKERDIVFSTAFNLFKQLWSRGFFLCFSSRSQFTSSLQPLSHFITFNIAVLLHRLNWQVAALWSLFRSFYR